MEPLSSNGGATATAPAFPAKKPAVSGVFALEEGAKYSPPNGEDSPTIVLAASIRNAFSSAVSDRRTHASVATGIFGRLLHEESELRMRWLERGLEAVPPDLFGRRWSDGGDGNGLESATQG